MSPPGVGRTVRGKGPHTRKQVLAARAKLANDEAVRLADIAARRAANATRREPRGPKR